LNRADRNRRRRVVRKRVCHRLAAADRDRPEGQAAASDADRASAICSGEALAPGEQQQAASDNHDDYDDQKSGEVTMQPMTVQGDLCVPSPLTYGGGFRATGAPKLELQLGQCRSGLLQP